MKTKEYNKKLKTLFPEFQALIPQLIEDNPRFSAIFEEHERLNQEISQLIQDPVNQINGDIERIKRKKLSLKDEMYQMLQKYHQVSS